MKVFGRLFPFLLFLLVVSACQSSTTATDGASLQQTRMLSSMTPTPSRILDRMMGSTFTPIMSPAPTNTRTPIPMNDIHSAGPFLSTYGQSWRLEFTDPVIFYELDGTGRTQISKPEDVNCLYTSDFRWCAYFIYEGGDHDNIVNLTLNLLNLRDGTTTEIARLYPSDYLERLARMVDQFIDEEIARTNLSKDEIMDGVSVSYAKGDLFDSREIVEWSPDNKHLAFPAMIDGDSTDLYVYSLHEKKIQRMENGYLNIATIKWSPTGDWLIYSHDQPVSTSPHYPIDARSVRMFPKSNPIILPTLCGAFYWLSPTIFLDGTCGYGCGGDPPRETNLYQIDITTGAKKDIWTGDWYSYAMDRETGAILISADDPCGGEQCAEEHSIGLFLGGENVSWRRIADFPSWNLVYRGGTLHQFVGLVNKGGVYGTTGGFELGLYGISSGIIDLLKTGAFEGIRISPDRRWMAAFGEEGMTLFDESDRVYYEWMEQSVQDIVWRRNSQDLYLLTDDQIVHIHPDSSSEESLYPCDIEECNYPSDLYLSIPPTLRLKALPNLGAWLPPDVDPLAGTTIWSNTKFRDLMKPGVNEYSVSIPTQTQWRWDFSWCTSKPDGLFDALEPLKMEFFIGGEQVGDDLFRVYDHTTNGKSCRSWGTILSGWQSGDRTYLEIRYTLDKPVHDGMTEYPAGEYRQIIHVTVE